MIVKHRRGTEQEWLDSCVIPEEGELVLVECSDGPWKCKIGDGITDFEDLPYIEDRTLSILREEITTVKLATDATLSNLEKKLSADLVEAEQSLYKEIENKTLELTKDFADRDTALNSAFLEGLANTAQTLRTELAETAEQVNQKYLELDAALTAEAAARAAADSAINAELASRETKYEADLKALQSADTANMTAIESLASQVNTLETQTTSSIAELTSEISSVAGEFDTKLSEKAAELADTIKVLDEQLNGQNTGTTGVTLKARLDELREELTSNLNTAMTAEQATRNAADEANATAIVSLTNTYTDKVSELEAADVVHSSAIETLDNKIDTTATEFDTKLTDTAAGLTGAIEALEKRILGGNSEEGGGGSGESSGGVVFEQTLNNRLETLQASIEEEIAGVNTSLSENLETFKSTANLKFMDVQSEIDQLTDDIQNFDPEISSKFEEFRAEMVDNKDSLNASLLSITEQINGADERITANTNNITEQTKRINNLIAPKESILTRDEEVIDIRVGYNGIDYESAGDAVRAIGKDLDALKASLPSYIPSNAVDGLEYVDSQLFLTSKGTPVGDPVTITGGGGGVGSISIVKVKNNLPSASFTVSKGTEAWIDFTYTSFENEVPTGDGVYSITINDKLIDKLSGSIQHGVAKRFNVIEYLKNGSNSIKVTCSDQYGSSRSLVYTISQVELRIESTFNNTQIFNDTITFRYKVFGQVEKTVYVLVDGEAVSTKNLGASVSGNETTLILPKQAHGCHKITAYVSAVMGDNTITSNTLEFEIICVEANNNTAIIASTYSLDEVTQGDLVSIPYIVYDPVQISSDIELVVYSQVAGELVEIERTPITVGREQQFWNTRKYPNGIAVFTVSYTYNLYGVQTTVTKSHTIKVNELTVDVIPEEDSMQLYLTAQGRSNNEQNPGVWSYTQKPDGEKTYPTVTTSFEGFNWKSNGWVVDAAGDTCLRLNGDARAIINFKPFAEDFKADGKTIEFEFVVRDVNDRDAIVIDCFDGVRGFRATPDTAFLKSSGTEVSCRYKDEERIRVAITVEHSDTTSRFVSIYLDGVLSGVQRYADTDNFQQNNPLTIKLGSNLCGLDIYNIRIYNKALSTAATLNNYIADQTVPATRLQLMTDNDILDENGKVSYDRVKSLGKIPIITFTGPMPTYKGDKKKKTTRMKFEDPAHPEMNFDVLMDQIDVQGTSSQFYIRKNWKVKLPEKRAHMPGAIPAKVFCIKVDYAEATGTHNTGIANYVETLYDREEVTLPPQKDDSRVRTTIQGFPIIIFEKENEDAEPVFSSKGNFNYDKDAENAFGFTEDYENYGVECWEFCNNTSDPVNFAGEIANDWLEDFEPRYTPKSSNFERIEELKEIEELAASGKGIMTEAQRNELSTLMRNCIANFKEMHDWVLSTATYTLVDGKRVDITPTALAEPVTYGETTYTEDNKEYRLAKFKYEFEDHFNMHYSSMYYVFTFFALMTDQRAKNLFLTRWKEDDGVFRWYPYFYDNDTIFGINNEGALVFDYFHEDTDQLGSSNVFNGQNSVLWNNFRLCFPQEIQATYAKLRSDKKLTYSTIINQFVTEGSDKWSAAIYNADADYKYVSMAREHVAHKDEDGNEVTGIDASNLYQVRGPGEHHLRYFIDNRINYCDSKWYAGNYPSDDIFLRIYTPKPADDATQEEIDRINASLAVVPANPAITITPFSDMYAGVRYKSGTLQQQRLKAGEEYTFKPLNENETFGDTETAIYGAGEISSLGDLSGLYCGVINLSNAAKLTELTVGNADPAYYNDNFREISVGSNRLLRYIDLRNCSGLGIAGENPQKTLELSGCPNIEYIYTEGTNLTSVNLPESGYIKVLHLPASINTLVIKNQHYLYPQIGESSMEDFVDGFFAEGYQNIRTLCIENCPNLNTNEILASCRDNDGKYTVERVRLTGIKWGSAEEPLENADFVKSLFPVFDDNGNLISGIRGINEKNNNLEDAYLVGTCYIAKLTGEDYAAIKAHYPYLDIKYGEMTANVIFMSADGEIELHREVVTSYNSETKNCEDPVLTGKVTKPTKESTAEFDYIWNGWTRRLGDEKHADALIEITGDRVLYPAFEAARRSYIITFINPTAPEGERVLAEISTLYGSDADYSAAGYAEPEKLDVTSPDLYAFIGWSPAPEKITGPMECFAQFKLLDDVWYLLGIHDIGDYEDYYQVVHPGHEVHNDGTMSVLKYNNYQEAAVQVPESLDVDGKSYIITSLGGFSEHKELNLIRLPNTLRVLSREAFAKCSGLEEFTIPESLQTVESFALQACTKLKEIIIPANLLNINEAAFAQCSGLANIKVAEGNTRYEMMQNGLLDKNSKKLIHGFAGNGEVELADSITSLGQYCFDSLPIVKVKIPDSITTISANAFSHCNSLVKVELPQTLVKLDSMCFAWNKNLSVIDLPDTLTSIVSFAFRECALSTVDIPAAVTSIGDESFGRMPSLHTVTIKARRDEAGNIVVPFIHKNAFIQSGGNEGIVFNVPWAEDYDYNYIDTKYNLDGSYTTEKIDPTGWGASNYTINYNYIEEVN